jgi:hypothetical protein
MMLRSSSAMAAIKVNIAFAHRRVRIQCLLMGDEIDPKGAKFFERQNQLWNAFATRSNRQTTTASNEPRRTSAISASRPGRLCSHHWLSPRTLGELPSRAGRLDRGAAPLERRGFE